MLFSKNGSEQYAPVLKIDCFTSALQPVLTSVGGRLITRDRGNCVFKHSTFTFDGTCIL